MVLLIGFPSLISNRIPAFTFLSTVRVRIANSLTKSRQLLLLLFKLWMDFVFAQIPLYYDIEAFMKLVKLCWMVSISFCWDDVLVRILLL